MSRHRSVAITAVLAAAVLVAGCADSGFHYVKSSEDKTYFKVPSSWSLFDEETIISQVGADLTETERQTVLDETWRVGFDSSPKPSLRHVSGVGSGHPAGLAVVRNLSFDVSDNISNSVLRNYFFDVDTALQDQTGELLDYEELQLDGGFRGSHLVANLTIDAKPITINQITLLDQATTKVYALIVTCSQDCYDQNKGQIEKVVDSWTVRDK